MDETNDVSSNSSTDTEDDDFQESKAQALRRECEEQKIANENLNIKFMLAEFDQTYENPKEEDIVQLPQDIAHELVDDKVNEISDNIQKENLEEFAFDESLLNPQLAKDQISGICNTELTRLNAAFTKIDQILNAIVEQNNKLMKQNRKNKNYQLSY